MEELDVHRRDLDRRLVGCGGNDFPRSAPARPARSSHRGGNRVVAGDAVGLRRREPWVAAEPGELLAVGRRGWKARRLPPEDDQRDDRPGVRATKHEGDYRGPGGVRLGFARTVRGSKQRARRCTNRGSSGRRPGARRRVFRQRKGSDESGGSTAGWTTDHALPRRCRQRRGSGSRGGGGAGRRRRNDWKGSSPKNESSTTWPGFASCPARFKRSEPPWKLELGEVEEILLRFSRGVAPDFGRIDSDLATERALVGLRIVQVLQNPLVVATSSRTARPRVRQSCRRPGTPGSAGRPLKAGP